MEKITQKARKMKGGLKQKSINLRPKLNKKRKNIFSETRIGKYSNSSSNHEETEGLPGRGIASPTPLRNFKKFAVSSRISQKNACNGSPPNLKNGSHHIRAIFNKRLNCLKKTKMMNIRNKFRSISPMGMIDTLLRRNKYEGLLPTQMKLTSRLTSKKKNLSRRVPCKKNNTGRRGSINKRCNLINESERAKPSFFSGRIPALNDQESGKDLKKRVLSDIFAIDIFGDLTSPRNAKKKCNMDLSKIVSDCELEAMKTNILANYDSSNRDFEL
ncbi:unnamed protein product [Moneuplotes crassus]|uniref:Uncharacterized protein n=1 Tax=Euplotes crassus TaxID=5936 RepID=A0AAD2D1I7_EUPCR|nr:unnamed protein product [Moneuplotes crassus]